MRWVFLCLLLVNILYALWQVQQGHLQLRSDSASTEVAASTRQVASTDTLINGAAPGLCMHLGGLAEADDVRALRQRLLALGVASRMVELDTVTEEDYVLVKSVAGGRNEALAALRLLQESGIESYLMGEGGQAGRIALGVFATEEAAVVRREQLQVQGYESDVEQLERYVSQSWLEVDAAARRLVDARMLQRLREAFPGLVHHYRPCGSLPRLNG